MIEKCFNINQHFILIVSFTQVASKPGAQQHEELSSPSVRHPVSRRSFSGPSYISHAQDTNNFYGEVKLGPPGYYRPY